MAPKNENLPVNAEVESPDGGTITYANEVIAIISGIAANEIEGIAGMVTSGGFGDIIGKNRNITRGVKVEVGTEEVSIDLYTIVEYGQPIQKVATEVQENVRKSIEAMTGLKVVRVDVHIQGVSFEKEKREVQSNLEAANVPSLPGSSKKKAKQKKEEAVDAKADAVPAPEDVEASDATPVSEEAPAVPQEVEAEKPVAEAVETPPAEVAEAPEEPKAAKPARKSRKA
ncbi:MAG: Asp23/Gls24 family envelope stress response protein [Clostridiales bacterium]|nr:Asp23/Gls24 family envelope stress response protein [Clostridiales bacterium]